MPVAEQLSDKIFRINEDLSRFIQKDENISKEFNEYAKKFQSRLSRASLAHFMFDGKTENGKRIIDIYLQKNKNLPDEDKKILKNFKNSVNSVFEIKKMLKDGFEMYNLVNEKDYTVKNLISSVNYRGVGQGNYFTCRLVPYENEYYLIVLTTVSGSSERHNALKLAVSMQAENPSLIYKDNRKKLKELEKIVRLLGIKFIEFFQSDEVITLNTSIDMLLDAFNNFTESGNKPEETEILIKLPEKYSYFDIRQNTDPFDFAEKKETDKKYDVGIVFDNVLGLQILPFYGTFRQIFKSRDYKSVDGYEACILDYFTNKKIPPGTIQKVYDNQQNKEKFMQIVCEVLGEKEITIEALLNKYKKDFTGTKKFSSTTVLYASESFEKLMETSEEKQRQKSLSSEKIGRNEPCTCGSGKKYKRCCM